MASIQQVMAAAEEADWERTNCAHESPDHIVYDYPPDRKDDDSAPFWRVHINADQGRHVTYIIGSDTTSQRVSLKNALDFIERVTAQYRKED
jgi:hypothetical protein